jgi:anhydro-N-acetylmuramic acid kinase
VWTATADWRVPDAWNEAVLARHARQQARFRQPPPKSLDRLDFPDVGGGRLARSDGRGDSDGVHRGRDCAAQEHLPQTPKAWIICGGGRPQSGADGGVAGASARRRHGGRGRSAGAGLFGAEAFAYLAVRSVKGLPLRPAINDGRAASDDGRRSASHLRAMSR